MKKQKEKKAKTKKEDKLETSAEPSKAEEEIEPTSETQRQVTTRMHKKRYQSSILPRMGGSLRYHSNQRCDRPLSDNHLEAHYHLAMGSHQMGKQLQISSESRL
jgi:hypothetical protein